MIVVVERVHCLIMKGKQFGVSSHTVREDLRIKFTNMLRNLRDDTVTEVKFPPTLTNIERKFLHEIAAELGLKSKSAGKGEARHITVTKRVGARPVDDASIIDIKISSANAQLLKQHFSPRGVALLDRHAHNTQSSVHSEVVRDFNRLVDDLPFLAEAHHKAQSEKLRKPAYAEAQRKRGTLPAFHYRSAVCSLVKEHQTILIRLDFFSSFLFFFLMRGDFCSIHLILVL